jgi:NAD(P)-dependent dehydrogenase (short-subunit alcohol dehydrogenase family)
MSPTKSVLIIGATGGLGLQCVRHLADEPSISSIHAFCRTPSKLSPSDKALCKTVHKGDALRVQDVEQVLAVTKANYVLLATGNGADLRKTNTRQMTGNVLATVLHKPAFEHVKIIVCSSNGAGGSVIKVGMGIGMLVSHHLRHVLADHTLQEMEFSNLMDRTLIVRPTSLMDNKSGKALVEFGDKVKGPTINADRADVALWITKEIAKGGPSAFRNRKVNLTSAQ